MSDSVEQTIAYEPRRFRSTVPFYSRYRLAYPPRLVDRVAERAGLGRGDRMLDLGCGPGPLALAFAARGAAVTAMDPEPDMLAAAEAAAAEAGLAVQFRQGSSYDLPGDLAPVKLVTMGRSFHWMDRAATLTALDRLIVPDGAIALFGEDHPDTVENEWRRVVFETGRSFGLEPARYRDLRRMPGGRCHESFLFESAFCDVESAGVFVRQPLGLDEIVGRTLSLSIFSPEKLGDRRDGFEAALRKALLELSPSGEFQEIAELTAVIARRG